MTARILGDDLREWARREPDRTAVSTRTGRLTYGELARESETFSAALAGRGVGRGDRVAILMPNEIDAVVAIYGVLGAGAALAPLNPSVKRERLAHVLADCTPRAIVCDERHAELAREGAGAVEGIEVLEGVAGSASARSGGPPQRPISVDLAAVIYTSGSTGEPKGVAVSHATMCFVRDSIVEYLEMGPQERVLCLLPLSFGYGLYQLLTCVAAGATVVLEAGLGLPATVVELLDRERITALPAVPTIFQVLLSRGGLERHELPHLRTVTNAGAALPEVSVRRLRGALPDARLFLMYGQTEAQRICYLPPEQVDARPTSVGVPIPGTELWVADREGKPVPAGEVGELIVRGAHVMHGYWGREEATAKKLRAGRWPWERVLATGDLFRRDEEGYLHFVSRTDDIIKSRGEKVAPREVEEVLCSASGVREAAVVGVPDEILGEAVHAHVAADPGFELDTRALRRACAERLEDHMVPQRVVVHEELPRTGNDKVDRRALVGSDTEPAVRPADG